MNASILPVASFAFSYEACQGHGLNHGVLSHIVVGIAHEQKGNAVPVMRPTGTQFQIYCCILWYQPS